MTLREIRSHLSRFTVGIAGAGGLGSNAAIALARSGIGRLIICDFDRVEATNLTRQYYFSDQTGMFKTVALKDNIYRIDPSVTVIVHNEKLETDNIFTFFNSCHVIIEALDRSDTKQMFIETVQTMLPFIPVIAGSGISGYGKTDSLRVRKIDNTLYVCGDEQSEDTEQTPAMAPRVAIAANMQANTAIELLLNRKKV